MHFNWGNGKKKSEMFQQELNENKSKRFSFYPWQCDDRQCVKKPKIKWFKMTSLNTQSISGHHYHLIIGQQALWPQYYFSNVLYAKTSSGNTDQQLYTFKTFSFHWPQFLLFLQFSFPLLLNYIACSLSQSSGGQMLASQVNTESP